MPFPHPTRRLAIVLALAALAGSTANALADPITLRIGVTPGPHAQILEAVKPVAAANGIEIKILEFSDYVVPNQRSMPASWRPTPSRTNPISTIRPGTAATRSSAWA